MLFFEILGSPIFRNGLSLVSPGRRSKRCGGAWSTEAVGGAALLDGDGAGLVAAIRDRCGRELAPVHRRVVNATGIVLHTGIGRAPLGSAARAAIAAAAGAAVVEVDPLSGQRNQREETVAALLRELCAEFGTPVGGALVVNNNAAATHLMLRALADGREAVVSRGELVEIGGGFRMPDVMAMAGCKMVEVGATNRTHVRDYEAALGADTGLLLKVHTSNFRVEGFAGVPSLAELVRLGRAAGVVVVEDLGSGLLYDQPIAGIETEPRVSASLAADPDVVCFSGDKLLGGPQCGILVGRADLIARIRSHAMYRTFRCDKLTLAALEATLRVYRDGNPLHEIPTLRALSADRSALRERADELSALLTARGVAGTQVVESESFVGSGANPARSLPSFATALTGGSPVADRLRAGSDLAVFARVADGRTLLDARTLVGEDLEQVADLVARIS